MSAPRIRIRLFLLASLALAVLLSGALAFDECDWGQVIEEGPWRHTDMCDGDPFDSIYFEKTAAIAAQVFCREGGWKVEPVDLRAWTVFAFGMCEGAAEGQAPVCWPESGIARHWGLVGGNHVFKWDVKSVGVDSDGIGCVPDSSYQTVETTISAPGCCASGCRDSSACEADPARAYTASTCSCGPRSQQCEEPENCVESPPCSSEHWYDQSCDCCKPLGSPIIVDLKDNGIAFSAPSDGMLFDIFANGRPQRVSWPLSPTAYWLALDRDGDGRIGSGAELFGNATRLASGQRAPHGYAALSEFDENGDGLIDQNDPIFPRLVLWRRSLPDSAGQPSDERLSMNAAGISSISLDVSVIGKKDRWGNRFRYRATVRLGGIPRWSYDVFLQVAPADTSSPQFPAFLKEPPRKAASGAHGRSTSAGTTAAETLTRVSADK